MEKLLAFSNTSLGIILIRVICIMFIGAIGSSTLIKKIADLFGLLSKSKKTKDIIFALADIISGLCTIGASILASLLFTEGHSLKYQFQEGLLYGFGAIGFHQFIIEGKLLKIITTIRGKK